MTHFFINLIVAKNIYDVFDSSDCVVVLKPESWNNPKLRRRECSVRYLLEIRQKHVFVRIISVLYESQKNVFVLFITVLFDTFKR